MKSAPSPAAFYFRRASRCYQQTRYVESIQHYLNGLELDVPPHYIYADLAKTYEMVGKWDSALACIEIALQLCPDSSTAFRRKTRFIDEKHCYEKLIFHSGVLQKLEFPPPDFLRMLTKKSQTVPRTLNPQVHPESHWCIELERFNLTCDAMMSGQTVWHISQLIQQTYSEIGNLLACYPSRPVFLSIINTNRTRGLQGSLPNWASGSYDYASGIQIAYCAFIEPVLGPLYSLIRHEWVHLLIHELTENRCPMWLDEGIAQCLARPMFQYEQHYVKQASRNGSLLPFIALNCHFSQIPAKKRKLAYLQSAMMSGYLIQQFGFEEIRQLLYQLRDGVPAETAIEQSFAMTLKEIQMEAVS